MTDGRIQMTEADFVSNPPPLPWFNSGAEGEIVITFQVAVDPFVCLLTTL